ncbi:c-type cytochrome [Pelagibius sp. Alg239-R121]|uniref:c-type cytochrome n=1 Tax=Pelagibius sp. Alg239-R121 TaxID=2993448 RepID=UPI0024A68809|nr:c-type cytochrome [Pelagibius sp. Alg239-R121]
MEKPLTKGFDAMTDTRRSLAGYCASVAVLTVIGFGSWLVGDVLPIQTTAFAQSSSEGLAGEGLSSSPTGMLLPIADATRGKRLFVSKGCVICHSINGVGGRAAPALDAFDVEEGEAAAPVDPLDFVVRMWRGAPAMLELQAVELGYQIELTAEELADLSVFASDKGAQAGFVLEDVPEPMWDWMLNEPYWEEDNWPEKLFEGYPSIEGESKGG